MTTGTENQAPEGGPVALPAAASPFCVSRVEVRGTRQELPITGVYDGTVYVHLESAPVASGGLLERVTTLREKAVRDGRKFSVEVLDEVISTLAERSQATAEGDATVDLDADAAGYFEEQEIRDLARTFSTENSYAIGGRWEWSKFTPDQIVALVRAAQPKVQPKGTPAEHLPTKEHIRELAQEALDQIMEQAQVFASAWSLVGGRFDYGNALSEAHDAKDELRSMVRSLADLAAETVRPIPSPAPAHDDRILSVILDELLFQKGGAPTPTDFRELVLKHPNHSADIADLAATWRNVQGVTEQEAMDYIAAHPEEFGAAVSAAQAPAAAPEADRDVTRILLDVVPGIDGMGEEVYADSVADVVAVMTRMGQQIEDLQAKAGPGWQTIETAPNDGRTLLLGYFNVRNKWRTVRGQWFSQAEIDDNWEEPETGEPGWYETVVESDDIPNAWRCHPTHWMPLPAAPTFDVPVHHTGGA